MLASEQAHREKDKAIRHAKSTLSAKDAVAGAIEGLASWKLPSIAAPRDVLPCIDVTELQLTTHEGHASAWLDLCFVCGSAGLDDALSVHVDRAQVAQVCGALLRDVIPTLPAGADLEVLASPMGGARWVHAGETLPAFFEECWRHFHMPEGSWMGGATVLEQLSVSQLIGRCSDGSAEGGDVDLATNCGRRPLGRAGPGEAVPWARAAVDGEVLLLAGTGA